MLELLLIALFLYITNWFTMQVNFERYFHHPFSRVEYGSSDKEWAELVKYRDEYRNAQLIKEQEILQLKNNVHKHLLLRIIYNVQIETHDGQCSRPTNLSVIRKTITDVVGLPTVFKKRNISVNGIQIQSIYIDDKLIQKLFSKNPKLCSRGSGYCGCKTTYCIRSTQVFTNINETNELCNVV